MSDNDYISNLPKIFDSGTLVGWKFDDKSNQYSLSLYKLDEKGTCVVIDTNLQKKTRVMVVIPKTAFVKASDWVSDSMFVIVVLTDGKIYATLRNWLKEL